MAYSGQAVFGGTTDPVTGSWNNATALNSTVVTTDITGYGVVAASFVITGTVTQGTAIFEVSDDAGTTWWPVSGLQTGNNNQATSFALTGSSASFEFATGAYNLFRTRLNPVILGSGSVAVRLSAEAFPFMTTIAVSGTTNVSITGTNTVSVSGTVAVTQSTSPWVVSLTSTTITGTVAVTQSTSPWTIQGDSASGAAKAGNPVQIGGVFNTTQPTVTTGQTVEAQATARGALIVATGTDAFAVNASQTGTWTVQQGSAPWSQNLTQVATTALGTPQTFGTAPTGVVIGTSSDIYVAGTRARSNQTTTAAGVVDVNNVGIDGVTIVTAAAGVQKVGIVGNTGAAVDAAGQNAASPANELLVAGQFNTTPTTISSGNVSPLQLDALGSLRNSTPDRTVVISLTAVGQTAQITMEGRSSAAFSLSSVGTGGQVVCEVSVDGVNWTDCDVWSEFLETWIINPATVASTGQWWFEPLGALNAVRVRCTVLTSGTITGTLLASTNVMGTFEYQAGDATTFPNNVIAIGGKGQGDGLMHGLLVDNTGKLQVAATSGAADTVGATVALNALNAAATVVMAGETSVGVLVAAGTLVGTLVPELSVDGGTTWASTYFFDPATLSFSTSIIFPSSPSAVTTRSILVSGGVSNVRVRVSAFTSGTANGTLRATVGAQGVTFSSQIDGEKATYRACSALFYTSAATPTDSFIISGSATKTVRVSKIFVQPFAPSNNGLVNVQIIKRSAANTGGTFVSDASTVCALDSNDPATTVATVGHYTANPTGLGASIGIIDQAKLLLPTSPNAFQVPSEFDFGSLPGAKSIVLRGVNQFVAVNFASSALPTGGMSVSVVVQYTEE